jgi:hypothetical protein
MLLEAEKRGNLYLYSGKFTETIMCDNQEDRKQNEFIPRRFLGKMLKSAT